MIVFVGILDFGKDHVSFHDQLMQKPEKLKSSLNLKVDAVRPAPVMSLNLNFIFIKTSYHIVFFRFIT